MPKTPEILRREVLELTPKERADLAFELLQSLDSSPETTVAGEAWIEEIERRARAALAGEPGITWSEARGQIEARLRQR
jgi:putative addiction module component (TIGR02574 family)